MVDGTRSEMLHRRAPRSRRVSSTDPRWRSRPTMKIWVGVTDGDWFSYLRAHAPDEVNFWQPSGSKQFKVLQPGEPFLFKLHSPQNYIVGGGFDRHSERKRRLSDQVLTSIANDSFATGSPQWALSITAEHHTSVRDSPTICQARRTGRWCSRTSTAATDQPPSAVQVVATSRDTHAADNASACRSTVCTAAS